MKKVTKAEKQANIRKWSRHFKIKFQDEETFTGPASATTSPQFQMWLDSLDAKKQNDILVVLASSSDYDKVAAAFGEFYASDKKKTAALAKEPAYIEYRIRPITRYVVTRYEAAKNSSTAGKSTQHGTFDESSVAYAVGYALAKQEQELLGWPPFDDRMQFPEALCVDGIEMHRRAGL